MKKYKFWIIISIVTSFFCWFFYPQEFAGRPSYLAFFSYLGRVMAFLLFPAIVGFIFKGIAKVASKDFSSKSFRATFLGIWAIIAFFGVINYLYDTGIILSESTSSPTKQIESIRYNSTGNEYSVLFKKKPDIKETTFLNNLKSETAELSSVNDGSYLRAESFTYNEQLENAVIDKFYIVSMLKKYAEYNGLQYPEFNFVENELGKMGKVRGYKTLKDDSGKEIKTTFVVKAYFGSQSAIFLLGASPSQIYPTPGIVNFFNSINKSSI